MTDNEEADSIKPSPIHCCTKHPDTRSKMAFLLFLSAMLTVAAAVPQDLSNKMFTFPQQTNTAHVRLTTSRQDLRAVSVCLRSFTDLSRSHSIFSLATPTIDNEVLIYKEAANKGIGFYIKNQNVVSGGVNYEVNTWHSICATWDFVTGVGQVWLDGKPSSRRFLSSGSSINGPIIIVLGQEQDSHGGSFDINQSFVGMMSDVHLWDYTISPCEISNYMENLEFRPGNVLNWGALEFQITGRVLIEDSQVLCY